MLDERKLHESVGANIKKLRLKHRYKQSDIAERIGLTRTSISNIETGAQNATLSVVYKFCRVFDVSLNEILPSPNEVALQTVKTTDRNQEVIGKKVSAVLEKIRSN